MSDVRGTAPGKVIHDQKGNAVWDWAIATGVLAKASMDELLSTLTGTSFLSFDPASAPPVEGEWSGDPYNRPIERASPVVIKGR